MNDNVCKRPRGLLDMHKLDEDTRIELIGRMMTCEHCIKASGGELRAPLMTDDEPGKLERYIKKLAERFPTVRVIGEKSRPLPGVAQIMLASPLAS